MLPTCAPLEAGDVNRITAIVALVCVLATSATIAGAYAGGTLS